MPRIESKISWIALLLIAVCTPVTAQTRSAVRQQPDLYRDANDGMSIDVGFTEPIETIKVAAAELGIIKKVNVKLGQLVNQNDLLMENDQSVLIASRKVAEAKAQQKARLNAAEVEYAIKEKRYQKIFRLMKDGAGSPQESERAQADAEVARQNMQAILEEINQFKLEMLQLDAQLERRRIRSPIRGVVVELLKKPGEHVSTNDPHVATVVQLETLRVIFHLSTGQAMRLKTGGSVGVVLPETGQQTKATVDYISPITSADSGRVRVDVLIDNRQNRIRSGMRCQISERDLRQARSPSRAGNQR